MDVCLCQHGLILGNQELFLINLIEDICEMKNRQSLPSQQRRDTIKCECGAEIELASDARVMGEAIEVHVALHMQKLKAPTDAEAERLRDDLIMQVFYLILSKTNSSEKRRKQPRDWKKKGLCSKNSRINL